MYRENGGGAKTWDDVVLPTVARSLQAQQFQQDLESADPKLVTVWDRDGTPLQSRALAGRTSGGNATNAQEARPQALDRSGNAEAPEPGSMPKAGEARSLENASAPLRPQTPSHGDNVHAFPPSRPFAGKTELEGAPAQSEEDKTGTRCCCQIS